MSATKDLRPGVLIVGVSTRALAISAARAGYRVTAIDAFGDLDLRGAAETVALRPEYGIQYSPMAAVGAAETVAENLVAYTSNLENYPAAVALLARNRCLLGNSASVLRRVRNPIELMRALRRRGFASPRCRLTPVPAEPGSRSWLLKPRRSGGGHGTAGWRAGHSVPKTHYLQERISGIPGSIVFAADGRRAALLGVTRQLVADACFGAHGFRYCGSMLGAPTDLFPRQGRLDEVASRIVEAVTEEFGLVGLNGIDFIARSGVPYPIEVNPRYSASMELIERGQGLSIFEVHAKACRGKLPAAPDSPATVQGKAVVFARRNLVLGDTRPWLRQGWLADVPHPGERIGRGRPICTVFATGRDAAACYGLLVRRAASVYRSAGASKRGAA